MKNIILNLYLLLSIVFPASAHAETAMSRGGRGDMSEYVHCSNTEESFVIRSTAAPNFKQGLLKLGENNYINLKCDETNIPLFETQSSAGSLLWSCREYPYHDGNIFVRIEQMSLTTIKSAYVSRLQMFPLEPQAIVTLGCR